MRKSHLLRSGTTWKLVAAAGLSPVLLAAADASAQTFAISIGVRETAAGGGPDMGIGNNAGTLGGIEFVNLDGLTLTGDGTWQQFTFTFGTDAVTAFAGTTANGILEGAYGALEHIRIRNSTGTLNPITMFIDDIVSTPAGGSPTVVSGFEPTDPIPATVGTEHIFQEPGFSGSTAGNVTVPNSALVTADDFNTGAQSNQLDFSFTPTNGTSAWVRMTSNNTINQANPQIALTPGSTLSFWMKAIVDAAPANFWIGPSGGNWNDPANWNSGEIPNGTNAVANLLEQTQPTTINLDAFTQINTVIINSPGANGYTISGSEILSMDGAAGVSRALGVEGGNHTISTGIEIVTGVPGPLAPTPVWAISTANAGDSLTTSGNISLLNAGTLNIDKSGPGTWRTSRIEAFDAVTAPVTLRVLGGTVQLIPGSGITKVNGLFFQGGSATPVAKLDITDNPVVLDYAPVDPPASPINSVRQAIAAAYNGGPWDGNGLTSSEADASFAVGYAEASALASVPAIFGTVDADSVLIRLTRFGDSNLDGQVNLSDFNTLAANFGQSDRVWSQGDFTYDGLVNLNDFNKLAANFGLSAAGTEVTPQDWSNLAAAVPEPGMLSMLVAGALPLMRRRRVR